MRDLVVCLARDVRAFFEAERDRLGIPFDRFPRGSCGDASLLLALVYVNRGIGAACLAGLRSGHSHAWVEIGDLIVDITADQFDEGHSAVTITRDRAWHSQFLEQTSRPPELPDEGVPAGPTLRRVWALLLRYLDERGA